MVSPLVALCLLAACGGGGGGGSGGGPSFQGYQEQGRRLVEAYGDVETTSSADLPTGRATYTGVTVLESSELLSRNEGVLLGRASVAADFDDNTISGDLRDFVKENGDDVSGSLRLENGLILGNRVITDVDGSLAGGRIVNGEGGGQFGGPQAEVVVIGMEGGILGGDLDGSFDGLVIADR